MDETENLEEVDGAVAMRGNLKKSKLILVF